jgi:ribosome recycling factor
MAYNFHDFNQRTKAIEEWLKKEFTLLRTGRATAAILDSINVESYGSFSPIAHVANIAMEDARTIRVSPWDKSQVKAIEAAIQKADIGISVATDGEGLRLIFPELTSERRMQVIKLLKDKLEEARISVRKERETELNLFKKLSADGEMSEDDLFKAKEELQKLVDAANRTLEDLSDKKEKEIAG